MYADLCVSNMRSNEYDASAPQNGVCCVCAIRNAGPTKCFGQKCVNVSDIRSTVRTWFTWFTWYSWYSAMSLHHPSIQLRIFLPSFSVQFCLGTKVENDRIRSYEYKSKRLFHIIFYFLSSNFLHLYFCRKGCWLFFINRCEWVNETDEVFYSL